MRAQTLAGIASVGALLFGFGEVAMSQTSQPGNVRNVVLVHGGWVDGSGWEGVYKALKKSGYAVTIVQEATTSLADDVATTKRAIASQNGPVILVGHSERHVQHREVAGLQPDRLCVHSVGLRLLEAGRNRAILPRDDEP